MKLSDLKNGDRLYVVESRRDQLEIREDFIEKVGRKYVTVQSDRWIRYQVHERGLIGANVYGRTVFAFRDENDAKDYIERGELMKELSRSLRYRPDWEKLNLSQLRRIKIIMEERHREEG